MDCGRSMIYFSTYENGVKTKRAGYAAIFTRGELCDIQIYYRGEVCEEESRLQPIYVFRDGTVVQGEEMLVKEGMAAAAFRTGRSDFIQSGRAYEELEVIYLDGVKAGICGGRPDGRELEETAYTLADWVNTEEAVQEKEGLPELLLQEEEISDSSHASVETWSLPQCMERLPELKLPFDGVRRSCCRMGLEEMAHLPEEWAGLKNNHFLLHGFYEYHHLLFVKLACRYGERYAIGVPGEFCYRNQYMAESFGFYDFAPLEPGKRRGGSFGYWYFYLEKNV